MRGCFGNYLAGCAAFFVLALPLTFPAPVMVLAYLILALAAFVAILQKHNKRRRA